MVAVTPRQKQVYILSDLRFTDYSHSGLSTRIVEIEGRQPRHGGNVQGSWEHTNGRLCPDLLHSR